MSGPFARALFRLSSKEYQERFVLCGDKDNYVVVDELVDDALYWAGKKLMSVDRGTELYLKIERLFTLLKERGSEIDGMSNYDVINRSQFWRDAGILARDILDILPDGNV
ncbi:MAG: hypothetical protein J7562_09060 [Agrobacterium tumefaciens]|nr:hypothetical protein [Agrobacterium tumefaciens]